MKTINLSFAQITIITVSCLVLGMISVGYVAAQTASSTEEAAASMVETQTTSGEVAGEATTTAKEPATPEPVQVAEAAPTDFATTTGAEVNAAATAEQEDPTETIVEQVSTTAEIGDIPQLEQEYMAKYGRYLQVMPGNTLPTTESGSVQSKFGKVLPENIRIDVYESPHGKGYQIYYEESGVAHSVGYGPEAADRTFTIEFPKPAASATSTSAVQ